MDVTNPLKPVLALTILGASFFLFQKLIITQLSAADAEAALQTGQVLRISRLGAQWDTGEGRSTAHTYGAVAGDARNKDSFASTLGFGTNFVALSLPSPPSSFPSVLQVGPDKQYATISAAVNAAQNGDVIEIDAGIYPETMTISKDVTLRGSGGYAHLRWGTGNYLTNTTEIANGKGILIIRGSNVFVENIEFSGAKVHGKNGAGIRYEAGNLTVRNSYFHHNENGILGQGGLTDELIIEHSIFERNGQCPADSGCAHNVYIGQLGKLIFRHNKSIASREGHTLKTRAHINEIIANFFSTKSGDGSYEVDITNGGTAYFIGNVVEQGLGSGNPSMMTFGIEGVNPNPALYVVNNTFYNYQDSGTFLFILRGAPYLHIKNNIFAGRGSIGVAADRSNLSLLDSTSFVDSYTGDYRLVSNSPAINAGVNPGAAATFNLYPQWEYVDPARKRARRISGAIDVGAYEFVPGTSPRR